MNGCLKEPREIQMLIKMIRISYENVLLPAYVYRRSTCKHVAYEGCYLYVRTVSMKLLLVQLKF
jgi:hypothetical protein